MKKHWFISLLTILLCTALLVCSLSACGDDKYSMKESTKEEKATILTVGGHEVPYELFRAFFLTRASTLSDSLTWEEKWENLMPEVLADVSRVYAVFSLCEKYGIDPYGNDVDKILQKRIKISIEGGQLNGIYISGYGKYSAYLDALSENYLTDRASRLLLRYQIAEEQLLAKLIVPYKSSYQYTEQDLKAFYESDSCRLIEMVYHNLANLPGEEGKSLVDKALGHLQTAESDEERTNICMQYFHIKPSKTLVSLYAFPAENGREMLDEAFSLQIGEYSQPLTVRTGTGDYIYLLRHIEKATGDFKNYAEDVEDLYLRDCFYRELAEKEAELQKKVTYTDLYREKENKPILFEEN